MSWNFVRLHEIFFQADAESFTFLSWKTKKVYSLKKFFRPKSLNMPREIQKMAFAVLIFSEGFVEEHQEIILEDSWCNILFQ